MAGPLVMVFLGALQASVSVLLTVFYGVIATQFDLLDGYSATRISRVCVRMFLPALLMVNVGSQLHADTGARYLPIFAWAVLYIFCSMALGLLLRRFTNLPQWITPALCFNNTTALPLLLMQSLGSAGVLSELLKGPNDTSDDALERAKSYFLVNSVVSNMVTFAIGPRLLDPDGKGDDRKPDHAASSGQTNGQLEAHAIEEGNTPDTESQHTIDENSSLLPNVAVQEYNHLVPTVHKAAVRRFNTLPHAVQTSLDIAYAFCNAPLIGAVIGAIIGLTPPLHKVFFNQQDDGGIFNAWLTVSVKNIGELFAALEVVVVGVKLSDTLRRMNSGEESGKVPWRAMTVVLLVRFVLWPVASIGLVYLIASRTSILSNDPVLLFAMMLMPTGPPAMKLTALADVSGADEREKMGIAKMLTISYAVSPILALTVVGALKATQMV